jgi:chaperone required for assembly of F1-ATPase
LLEGRLDLAEAFAAAQLDESFQIEAWGEDMEQAERRAALAAEIAAAVRFISLVRS